MVRWPIIKVIVAGNDVTGNVMPVLLKVKVNKKEKGTAHTAELTLADPDGMIEIPPTGAPIQVFAGLSSADVGPLFNGTVNDVKSKGEKDSGRMLAISSTAADQKSKVKQQITRHRDNASFGDVAKDFGQKAGLDVQVIGDLASVSRKYWAITRESFPSWGQRIADEIGASFQIIGKRAFFSSMNDGKSVSGKSLTPIHARTGPGGNLISWDIAPTLARPDFAKVSTTYFDRKSGDWKTRTQNVEGSKSDATLTLVKANVDEDQADKAAKGKAEKSKRDKGGGSIKILGDHAAEPGAFCTVSGAREGVDNTYIVESVEHDIDKEGWVTGLELKLPKQGGNSKSNAMPLPKKPASPKPPSSV